MSKPDVMVTSASQFKTFFDCQRKWWFNKVARLPEPMKKHFAFGTCLHSVAERFLNADETGRNPDGTPVELYPDGWHIIEDRGMTVVMSVGEQNLIRALIDDAIEKGVLVRAPGRIVEHEFRRLLFEVDGTRVEITGFIDVLLPGEVQDHKTSKSTRYFQTAKKLAKDVQMLLYGAEVYFKAREQGAALPDVVTLRHNQYLKVPKDDGTVLTRERHVDVTLEDVQRNWNRCVLAAQTMWGLRQRDNHRFVPESLDSCNKYGGCSYLSICSGRENPGQYKSRMARLVEGPKSSHRPVIYQPPTTTSPAQPTGETTMTVFQNALGAQAPGAAPPAAAPGAPVFPTTPPPAAPAAVASAQPAFAPQPTAPAAAPPATQAAPAPVAPQGYPTQPTAPWAIPGCAACQGVGINTAGNPCGICSQKQQAAQGIAPSMFNVGPSGNGLLCWQVLPDFAPNIPPQAHQGSCVIPNSAAFQGGVPTPPPQPAAAPAPTPEQTPPTQAAPAPSPPEAPKDSAPSITPPSVTAEQPGKAGKGRPKKGITVYVNCLPSKGVKNTVRMDDLFVQYADELAKSQGVESYFALDVWRRRDMLGQVIPVIVEALKTSHVVCSIRGDNADAESFAKKVLSHASIIIEAIA